MILTLAIRSLLAHPVRTAVLAAGFGLGVAVMAILLGVGQVVLAQARSPQLAGGGDVLVTGAAGEVAAARVLLGSVLRSAQLAGRTRAASPWSRATLHMVHGGGTSPVRARGGIPSLERALRDPEIAEQPAWTDTAADAAWASPDPADVLRAIDRFRPVPDAPDWASSWAEWLYFNGRSAHGRFYLTFLVGAAAEGGRTAGVRLQLDLDGRIESFTASAILDEASVARAPDLSIAGNDVRLEGLRYRIRLDLAGERGRRAIGELWLDAAPARLLPPIEIHGARGWRSGYVVPVMSGALGGTLRVAGRRIDFQGGTGYHDHNWGFWDGVSWQWGQVQHDELSLVFGRVFPPPAAADPSRMPGFLAALGAEGPIGYATDVSIQETNDAAGRPEAIVVRGRSPSLELSLAFEVGSVAVNRMNSGPLTAPLDFLQMRGIYRVEGHAGDAPIRFEAPGTAETFRGR